MMVTSEDINAMLEERWPAVDIECLDVCAESALAVVTPGYSDLRPGGFISGPAQFAIADAALWFLVSGALGRAEPMTLTSELSIRFLRPGLGQRLYARATLDKLGRRNLVGTIRIWTDDEARLCAVAQGTYALPDE